MRKLAVLFTIGVLCLVSTGCGAGSVQPKQGKWEGLITFPVEDQVNVVMVRFTVGENGNIEDWSAFDAATGSVSLGGAVEVVRGTFVLEQELNIGTSRTSKRIEGTFVAPDRVEGTFEFTYSWLGTFEGEWEGAPAQ